MIWETYWATSSGFDLLRVWLCTDGRGSFGNVLGLSPGEFLGLALEDELGLSQGGDALRLNLGDALGDEVGEIYPEVGLNWQRRVDNF